MAMLILGIETATMHVGCAIGGHEGVLAHVEVTRGRRHAESLAPMIEYACTSADVELAELGCIAVDVGPGLFTGMRVGIATAKALAHALHLPVIAITSLDLLAFPVRHSNRVICTVIDARRGEVFFALYRQVPGGVQRIASPAVGTADDVLADVMAQRDDVLLVGDGALRYRDVLEEATRVEFAEQWLSHPSAATLVQLAHPRALREDWVHQRDVEPLYLRRPDAAINWETRARVAP
jgi:tRNA threonylcarbamoyladenosine biosynthesis protein TsaB